MADSAVATSDRDKAREIEHLSLGGVSGFYHGPAVSVGPVFAPSFDEADENVLASDAKAVVQIICHALVESALLFQRSPLGQRQLHEDQVLAAADTEEVRVIDE